MKISRDSDKHVKPVILFVLSIALFIIQYFLGKSTSAGLGILAGMLDILAIIFFLAAIAGFITGKGRKSKQQPVQTTEPTGHNTARNYSLNKKWYLLALLLVALLILNAILQNHLYFTHYYQAKGWSTANNVLSVISFFIVVVLAIGLIVTLCRYLAYRRKGHGGFSHAVTSFIVVSAALFIAGSAVMLGAEKQFANNCINSSQSKNNIGHHACVQFHVAMVFTSGGHNTFIDENGNDYRQGFSAYVPDGSALSSQQAHTYQGKTIKVTGTITSYRGAPQILVSEPSQVKVVN
ncbi:MAG TPA: hypothetical protein VJR27_00125 [Candidatus Saccharimonadales bacterium]|nr:hypothetical protein [Candidatus Saccharimonadales bacterium]